MPLTICFDAGHGNWNKNPGQYDPGFVFTQGKDRFEEAAIAMIYVNKIRDILKAAGHTVIRTRRDAIDPAPVSRRDDIARAYKCDRMVSIHCNAANTRATGTEVFYRGADDRPIAAKLSALVANAFGIKDRGAKTEKQSQHKSLAVLEFDKCWLIELAFLDNPTDRAALLDPGRMSAACHAIAKVITSVPD